MKTIRRLYIYLVTLISLEVVVWALITLARSIFAEGFTLAADSLAGGLAFILVGLPVFFFHWWLAQRDAQQDEDEAYSGVRTFFLYAAWIALAVPVVHSVLSILMRTLALILNLGEIGLAFGTDQSWSDNLIPIVVNAVLAIYFRRVIVQLWQKPQGKSLPLMRRINHYFWMLYGLLMLYGGAVLLLLFMTEDVLGGVDAAMVNGISFALIGTGVWVYSWQIIKNAISDTLERSSWIRLGILYALSLLGALATLIPAGVILGDLLNGIFGETAIWSNFLLEISVAFSVLIPSAVVWRYFQQTLWLDTEILPQISEVAGHRRVYYYVLSLAGLIATFTALQLLAVWLIDMFVPPRELWGAYPREGLAYILATLLVSLPVWTLHWRPAQLEIDDLAADLTFTSTVNPWRPDAGKAYFRDLEHYFAWLPSVPYGLAEGTLTYDDQVHQVKGGGYHDHNWGNIGLNEITDHWYWGRAHLGDYTLIFAEIIASKKFGYKPQPVFMLAKGSEVIIGDGVPLSMDARDFVPHSGGRKYPNEVDIHWQKDEETVHLALRNPQVIEAISLLLILPAWQRPLLRLFSNPYYFRFNADLEMSVNLKNSKTVEQGTTLFEIMILQGKNHP